AASRAAGRPGERRGPPVGAGHRVRAMAMTMFDTPTTTTTTTTTKFTEAQALDWLAANPNTSKTIREIAAIWGWSRSTTQRFVSRGTSVGQGENFAETLPKPVGQVGQADGAAQDQGRVLGRTPSGTVVAAMPDASDLDDGPPIARAPYSDNFDWAEDESVVVPPQQAIAVYRNACGQVVIRAKGGEYEE